MPTATTEGPGATSPWHASKLSSSDRRTLEALFRHPIAHNLAWIDVVALFDTLGTTEVKANSDLVLEAEGEKLVVHKPHNKQLTTQEVLDVRRFVARAGGAPGGTPNAEPGPASPDLVVVVDYKEARVYRIDVAAEDATKHVINPYDPHHFLHHVAHMDGTHEHGDRTQEDAPFHERIAQALAGGGRIVAVGHGTGKANACHSFVEYLKVHHHDTWLRVATEVVADISSLTAPQLLAMGQKALR